MIDGKFLIRWTEALRNGGYKQGFGFLRCGDKFCPFGVACDIEPEGKWTEKGVVYSQTNIFADCYIDPHAFYINDTFFSYFFTYFYDQKISS